MAEEAGFNIDAAGAAEAIDNAGGLETLMARDNGVEPSPQPQQAPEGTPSPTPGPYRNEQGQFATPPQPEVAPPADPAPAEEAFTNVDPNSLPPELQGIYRSMQADYTRKTQEVAEYRRLASEMGVDPQQLQSAVEVYNNLQDPRNWLDYYTELGQALENYGLMPREDAGYEGEGYEQPQAGLPSLDQFPQDPELAPIRQAYDALSQEVQELRAEQEQRRQAEQQEQLRNLVFGEMQRQEAIIRQQNPSYDDQDINAIWALSSAYEGNLLAAQQQYEATVGSRIQRYFSQKQEAVPAVAQPLPGAGTPTAQPTDAPETLEDAHVRAMEHLRLQGFDVE